MAGMVLPKPWDAVTKALAGIVALNVGLAEFVNVDLLTFVPSVAKTVVIGVIGLAGLYILQLLYNKRI